MSLPSLTRLCVAAVDALPEDVVRSIANNYPLVKKTLEAHVLAKDSHGDSNVIADITIEVRGWISTYGRSTNRRDTVADRYEHNILAGAFEKGWDHVLETFASRSGIRLYPRDIRLGSADATEGVFTGTVRWSLFSIENDENMQYDKAAMVQVAKECVDTFMAGMADHTSPYVTFNHALQQDEEEQISKKIVYSRNVPVIISPLSNLTLTWLERYDPRENLR